MAKMVKCPTCGTAIEVPAQLTGQILKCPGCGKGLKLVAKKPAQPPVDAAKPRSPGGSIAGGSVAGGSIAGGSVAGASVSAMSFHGEPPSIDDPPSLDTNCAVCGRPTDPDDLVEDNGRLVCPDCIKGARSSIARPKGGAELLDFKAPAYAPVRRGKIINITPAFLAACFAALVWAGCQFYLSGHAKPVGVALAKSTKPQPKNPTVVETPTTAPETSAAATTQPDQTTAQVPPPPAPTSEPAPAPVEPGPVAVVTPPPVVPPVEPASKPSIFSGDPNEKPPVPTDPFEQGLERLQAKDYAAAARIYDTLRSKYAIRGQEQATPQQLASLEGLAVANMGLGNTDAARIRLDAAYKNGGHARSLTLNRAITTVMSHTVKLDELKGPAAAELKHYLESQPGDEFAADIFGAMLWRLNAIYSVENIKDRTKDLAVLEPFWAFLETYNDQLAKDHPNQLKWGSEWMPAEDVRRYRLLRNKADTLGVTKAQKDLDAAKKKAELAKKKFDEGADNKAKGEIVDLVGLQAQLDGATAKLTEAQKVYDDASQLYKAPHWPEKFDPVLPEPMTESAK
jgi:hypothetical protein